MSDSSQHQPTGQWLNDRIVAVDQQSDWGLRDHAPYRIDGGEPYLRLHFVAVYVSDQERSLRFYVDTLGFRLVTDARFASGNRWVEVAPPDGSASLALVLPASGLGDESLIGNSGGVTFLTEDVEGKYREWSARGVHFSIPPQTPAWGGTFCRFHDPDGNTFSLAGFTEVTRAIDDRRRALADKLEAERRAAQELEIARQVQSRLFPQRLPVIPALDYAGLCVQARSVGGDYYDFLDLGAGRMAFVLGDIAGKGIAAALLMANLQAALRSQYIATADRPDCVLSAVNRLLYENTADHSYATLFFADYNSATGRIRYANCGHLPAVVFRADGSVDRLAATSTVLGLFAEWDCAMGDSHLAAGDTLLIATDGVYEAFNDHGEEFGEDRLIGLLKQHQSLPAASLAAAIVEDVQSFSNRRPHDDVTLIVAKRTAQ